MRPFSGIFGWRQLQVRDRSFTCGGGCEFNWGLLRINLEKSLGLFLINHSPIVSIEHGWRLMSHLLNRFFHPLQRADRTGEGSAPTVLNGLNGRSFANIVDLLPPASPTALNANLPIPALRRCHGQPGGKIGSDWNLVIDRGLVQFHGHKYLCCGYVFPFISWNGIGPHPGEEHQSEVWDSCRSNTL